MNTVAAPNCYGCLSTGRIVGFGFAGAECACVAHCEECDGAVAWRHDDERAPNLCAACECPETLRATHEGLATFLVSYYDDTASDGIPVEAWAYVDAYAEHEACATVESWGGYAAVPLTLASEFAPPWERAAARRFYRETAEGLS